MTTQPPPLTPLSHMRPSHSKNSAPVALLGLPGQLQARSLRIQPHETSLLQCRTTPLAPLPRLRLHVAQTGLEALPFSPSLLCLSVLFSLSSGSILVLWSFFSVVPPVNRECKPLPPYIQQASHLCLHSVCKNAKYGGFLQKRRFSLSCGLSLRSGLGPTSPLP